MRLDLTQHMRLEQRMKMAPRMIQSMEILQLPLMALQERIDQERLENPLLELAGEAPSAEGDEPPNEGDAPDDAPAQADAADEPPGDSDLSDQLLREWEEHFTDSHRPSRSGLEEEGERKFDAEQNIANKPPGLHETLLDQLHFVDCPPEVRDAAIEIIYNLDENGYLTSDLADLADPAAGPAGLEAMERALAVVQGFEPTGVGAASLAECLILQIPPDHPLRDAMTAICRDHLQDVQQNRLPVIEKRTGLDMDTINEAIEAVRHLNPRPGAAYLVEHVPTITPDVFLDETEDGYKVRVDEKGTPPLRISKLYRDLLGRQDLDPETRAYLQRKIQSARWLIESIEQRRNTLARVAQAIVDHQRDFLDKGPSHIRPLKMQQIADRVGVHVTTVSRAVDSKYVETPRGVFPLKRFFGGGTETADGKVVAWDTIKQQLVRLIEEEDKSKPYSDDQLVKIFAEKGFQVSRRAVTKYRNALDIASARRRKQY